MEDLDFFTNVMRIYLDRIRQNFLEISEYINAKSMTSEIGVVLKSDAYGIGIKQVAPVLYNVGARKFFVVSLQEALLLKEMLESPVVYVFSGLLPNTESVFYENSIIPVLYTEQQLHRYIEYAKKISKKLDCIIKFDTGMNRMGIKDSRTHLIKDLAVEQYLDVHYIMSHTYSAHLLNSELNAMQLERFDNLRRKLPQFKTSLSNTYSAFFDERYYSDLFRIGRALYGVFDRVLNNMNYPRITQCAFSVQSRVVQVKDVKCGEKISYGSTHTFDRDSKVATLGIGYAHGLPVSLSNKGYVIMNGKPAKIIGKVTMEYIMLDITDHGNIEENSWVSVVDSDTIVDDLAGISGVTSLELMSSFSKGVQKKMYFDGEILQCQS